MDKLFILWCLSITIPGLLAMCPSGFCNLSGSADEPCDIPTDTICSRPNQCNNKGRCFQDAGATDVFCSCDDGWYGDQCQYQIEPEDHFICSGPAGCTNNGSCIVGVDDNNTTSYICHCQPGFYGPHCQHQRREWLYIDRSEATFCGVHGFPYKQGAVTGCYCICGYIGEYCSDVSVKVVGNGHPQVFCTAQFCNANGKCSIDATNSFVCKCTYDFRYYGRFCEFDRRDTTPLSTQASVITDVSSTTSTQQSANTTHITGNTTSSDTDIQCTLHGDHRCRNGGQCLRTGGDITWKCICNTKFTGTFCEVEVVTSPVTTTVPTTVQTATEHWCGLLPACRNSGTCITETRPLWNYTYCQCSCGFFGQLCEFSTDPTRGDYRDWCQVGTLLCAHGGQCVVDDDGCGRRCLCPPSYTGLHCEYPLPVQTTTQTICDRNQACVGITCGRAHTCVVDNACYPYCEISSTYTMEAQTNTNSIYWFVTVCFITTFILVIVTCCVVQRKRRQRLLRRDCAPMATTNGTGAAFVSLSDTSVPPAVPGVTPTVPPSAPPSVQMPGPVPMYDLPSYEEACADEQPPSYQDIKQYFTRHN